MKKFTVLAFALLLWLPSAAERRIAPIFPDDEKRTSEAPVAVAEAEAEWAPAPGRLDSLVTVVRGESSVAAFEKFFDEFIRIDSTLVLTSDTPDSVYQRRLRSILSGCRGTIL